MGTESGETECVGVGLEQSPLSQVGAGAGVQRGLSHWSIFRIEASHWSINRGPLYLKTSRIKYSSVAMTRYITSYVTQIFDTPGHLNATDQSNYKSS